MSKCKSCAPCFKETGKFLQFFDYLDVPVTLTYEGKKTYRTACGGICTCGIAIVIIGLLVSCVELFTSHSKIASSFSQEYLQFYNNDQSYQISNDQAFFAFKIEVIEGGANIQEDIDNLSIVVPKVFVPYKVENTVDSFGEVELLSYKNCSEVLASEISESTNLQNIISGNWMCIDTNEITLLNSLWYDNNSTLMFQVVSCYDFDDTSGCLSESFINDNLKDIIVTTKMVSKYFDLSEAQSNGLDNALVWHGDKQWTTPLGANRTSLYFYEVGQQKTSFNNNPVFNFQSFQKQSVTTTYTMDQVHYLTTTGNEGDSSIPYYQMLIEQSPRIRTVDYSVVTIVKMLAYFGGITVSVIPICYFVISLYQEFSFKRSMLESSLTKKREYSRLEIPGDQPHEKIMNHIQNQVPYQMPFCHWFKSYLCAHFCCCTKKGQESKAEYELHDEGYKRLCKETDILNIVKEKRVSNFMTDAMLRTGQKQLVSYQSKYYLDETKLGLPAFDNKDHIKDDLKNFAPETNNMDQQIIDRILPKLPKEVSSAEQQKKNELAYEAPVTQTVDPTKVAEAEELEQVFNNQNDEKTPDEVQENTETLQNNEEVEETQPSNQEQQEEESQPLNQEQNEQETQPEVQESEPATQEQQQEPQPESQEQQVEESQPVNQEQQEEETQPLNQEEQE